MAKHLALNYPIAFFTMVRFWAFAGFAILVAARSAGSLPVAARSNRPVLQIVRALSLVAALFVFTFGLRYLKLVEIHSIFAVHPLMVTVLAIPVLGEKVGWRRWVAVVVGFIGVLVILRPGFDIFRPAALIPLGSGLLVAGYVVLNRLLTAYDSFATSFLYTGVVAAIVTTLIGMFYWVTPAPMDWIWIFGLGLTSVTGHGLMIKSMEYADASVLQPINYLLIVSATFMGWLVFSEVPDLITLAGAAIIVGSGLFIIWWERVRRRRQT